MKPLGLAERGLSEAGSSVSRFLLSPTTLFPLDPEAQQRPATDVERVVWMVEVQKFQLGPPHLVEVGGRR